MKEVYLLVRQKRSRRVPPTCRQNDLVVQELEGEILAYDLKTSRAHCLNGSAAEVWALCDGRTTVAEIADQITALEEVVWLALDVLDEADLLEGRAAARPPTYSRRSVLGRLTRTAVVVPVVAVILAPLPAAAGSACGSVSCTTCTNISGGQTCTVGCENCPGNCWRANTSCGGAPSEVGITCTQCDTDLIPDGQQGCAMAGGCSCLAGGGFNNCSFVAA